MRVTVDAYTLTEGILEHNVVMRQIPIKTKTEETDKAKSMTSGLQNDECDQRAEPTVVGQRRPTFFQLETRVKTVSDDRVSDGNRFCMRFAKMSRKKC
jgi:hypothetical protein